MRNPSSPLSSINSGYLQELEARYRADPESVDAGWRCVLDVLEDIGLGGAEQTGAAAAQLMAVAYRRYGHLSARLDPLGLGERVPVSQIESGVDSLVATAPAQPLVERLRSTYCGTLAVESGHNDKFDVSEWIRAAVEAVIPVITPQMNRDVLERLVTAEEFERFMAVKFPAKKRFGAEGAEALVPLLDRLVRNAAMAGVTDIVVGTMHRGRLNAAANVFGKRLETLFAEFKGLHPFGANSAAAADVPYHLGHEADLLVEGRKLRVTVSPNPSHLEAVNTVVLGRVRARQDALGAAARVLGVIIHTDASVVGQGVVAEMLQLGGLTGFSTGGTIHVIINNQIGFTTEPHEARTSYHCSGPWKAVDSLILHANGDEPWSAIRAADLAVGFRQAQSRDAVIDLVCYRRNGHNEVDEPRFTQPLLYDAIRGHASVAATFGAKLLREGSVSAVHIDSLTREARARLELALGRAEQTVATQAAPATVTSGDGIAPVAGDEPVTGLPLDRVIHLLAAVSAVPADLAVNQKLERILAQRSQSVGTGLQWAVGEALAFAGLVAQGISVRMSGQDAVRGVFSQRHLSLSDTETGRRHVGLEALATGGARFEAVNSPLSEYAVLGFEYGYSVEQSRHLVIWEAQFGDFANGAQIIIDQFVVSAEEKWRQSSGLVMLLPHGLEGQGPEHSSGRLERFLQLCAQNNLQVTQPSTPANYFHLLRRQALVRQRKPLVIMTPKSLLRHPSAVSPLAEFATGGRFHPVIASCFGTPIRHVLVCSGKVAYDLAREREARTIEGVAIVRLERLYPFPTEYLTALFRDWRDAQVIWVQDEPRNLGAWAFVDRHLEGVLEQAGVALTRVTCVSRPESASPAGSFHGNHERDQRLLIDRAFYWADKPAETVCAD